MRSVRDIKVLENIPVLLRTSLNAPIENGVVTNAFRLKSALPTIQYLRERHARVVLISHISGKGTETLEPMYEAMKQWLPDIAFCPVATGAQARAAVRDLLPGGVLMLENLRRNVGEEKNDGEFAKELAELADVFVQDSFDVCHREHASVVGVPGLLPSYAGLTLEQEVKELTKALKPKHPAVAIIGGAKFSTKEPVLKKLLKTYDHVFVGGALANDFLKAKGYSVGTSLVSDEGQDHIKKLLKDKRLIVPVDVIAAPLKSTRDAGRTAMANEVKPDEAVLDAGPHTAAALVDLINKSKTVLWNGPLGLFENGFSDATRMVARAVVGAHTHSIIGGGDTIAAVEEMKPASDFSFISTGGGAMLDFLAHGTLPGIKALK
ncbi:MAG TPA: phosphoglycerate kinase [Candidatus Paceibacterota bacterium]|nr:phosphoglycerate kinase [Candidatus Paceibacterota bacterium]